MLGFADYSQSFEFPPPNLGTATIQHYLHMPLQAVDTSRFSKYDFNRWLSPTQGEHHHRKWACLTDIVPGSTYSRKQNFPRITHRTPARQACNADSGHSASRNVAAGQAQAGAFSENDSRRIPPPRPLAPPSWHCWRWLGNAHGLKEYRVSRVLEGCMLPVYTSMPGVHVHLENTYRSSP